MSQYFANKELQLCPNPGADVCVAVKMLPANNSRVERLTLPSHVCAHKHTMARTGFSAQLQLAAILRTPLSPTNVLDRWSGNAGEPSGVEEAGEPFPGRVLENQHVQTVPALLIKLSRSHTFAHRCNHWRITSSLIISLKDREL